MRTVLCVLAVSLVAGGALGQGFGQPGRGGMVRRGGEGGPEGGGPQGMIERLLQHMELAKELGLSEEQVGALRDELFALKTKQIDLRAELEKTAMAQARLMTDKDVDEEALMAAIEKTGAIRTEIAKLRIQPLLLIKRTLTPEQAQQLRGMMKERMMQRGRAEGGGQDGARGQRRAEVRRNRMEQPQEGRGDRKKDGDREAPAPEVD